MVKMLTVLVSTISNSQVFLLKKKNVSSFCIFFSSKILVYLLYLMIKVLTITLTNDIVSFEQLGPGYYLQKISPFYSPEFLERNFLSLYLDSSVIVNKGFSQTLKYRLTNSVDLDETAGPQGGKQF